jgi:signal transduction histidine kinase
MRERALLADGELEIESEPGRGTRVRLLLNGASAG